MPYDDGKKKSFIGEEGKSLQKVNQRLKLV